MLRRLTLALSLSTALVAAGTAQVQAGPAIAAVGAFAATPVGGVVVNLAVGLAFNAGAQLINNMVNPDESKPDSRPVVGYRGTVSGGDDGPAAFILGYGAAMGSTTYRGVWGNADKVPNAFYVHEKVFSDIPLGDDPGPPVLLFNGKRYPIDWDAVPTAQGYPIPKLNKSGKDYGWVRWQRGTQTTADSYLRSKFGDHAEHPYTADMVGRGQAKMVLTLRVNAKLFKGFPEWGIESVGINQYNPAKDSTRGGSGAHRIDNPATWEPSNLLPVCMHTVWMGVQYGGEVLWGGIKDIGVDELLPSASFIAAIATANTNVGKKGGGTEKQYVGGMEVTVDMEPASVLEHFLRGCDGRTVELGGSVKTLCGLPASPVFSFTDDNIIISRAQQYDPFPPPEQIFNAIESRYRDPRNGWKLKDAPRRKKAEWIAADGVERCAGATYEVVQSGTQAQRLDLSALLDGRRWRTHAHGMPPEASELEPLDMVSWTSDANGYVAKKFLITEMLDEETFEQFVTIREVEPADHGSYDPDEDEVTMTFPSLEIAGPDPVVMAGYQVFPATFDDSEGAQRRPTIRCRIPGGLDDVDAIEVSVRLASSGDVVYFARIPYVQGLADGATFDVKLNAVLLGETVYEVQFTEVPFGTRDTEPTPWFPVTTEKMALGAKDIDLIDLAGDVLAKLGQTRVLIERFKQMGTMLEEADLQHFTERRTLARSIETQVGDLRAGFFEIIETAISPLQANVGALALAVQTLYAAMGSNMAAVNVRWEARAAPSGYAARYAIQCQVNDGQDRQATFFVDVPANPNQPTRIGSMAGQFVWFTSNGTPIASMDQDGHQRSSNGVIDIDWIGGGQSVTIPD